VVWTEEEIQAKGFNPDIPMSQLAVEIGVKILGNLDLSNELAVQTGWTQFLQWASTVPQIQMRIDWKVAGEKRLKAFGIKQDSEDIWLPDEVVQEKQQAQAEQAEKQRQQEIEGEVAKETAINEHRINTQAAANIQEKGTELLMEQKTGGKVQ